VVEHFVGVEDEDPVATAIGEDTVASAGEVVFPGEAEEFGADWRAMSGVASVEPVSPMTMRSMKGATLVRQRASPAAPFFTIMLSSMVGIGRRGTGAQEEWSA
jgi:hypothetical protein